MRFVDLFLKRADRSDFLFFSRLIPPFIPRLAVFFFLDIIPVLVVFTTEPSVFFVPFYLETNVI